MGENPFDSDMATRRGFTDHEHLDEVELIHMNGRVFDYQLGRFLSVDPYIQEPGNSQSINPYSYIMNNPMAGTDPTGYRAEEGRCQHSGYFCSVIVFSGQTRGEGSKQSASVQESNGTVNQAESPLASAGVGGSESMKTEEIGSQFDQVGTWGTENGMETVGVVASRSGNEGFGQFAWGMFKRFAQDTLTYAHSYITGLTPEEIGDPMGLNPVGETQTAGSEAYDDNALVINTSMVFLPGRQQQAIRSVTESVAQGKFPTKFHKRSVEEVAKLRKEFESMKPEFIRSYANSAEAAKRFTPQQLAKMNKSGRLPKGYIVHHKNPLFRGGDNSFDNFRVMNAKFHQKYNKRLHWYDEGKNIYQK
nr:RHS repeat-associated core domain-containing protein [Marinibactrum halimedae]